mmetsp:Transcript_110820/g.286507  ORF Transcript_110820/g.286507 Transcript_110820/m.286507 type:complete len:221 (-) Transcript_110820:47-709(-)
MYQRTLCQCPRVLGDSVVQHFQLRDFFGQALVRAASASPSWRHSLGGHNFQVVDIQRLTWHARIHVRPKITVPERKLTKKVSRSSGPGGQSVNMSDTRVQLSFKLDKADWIPGPIREKMKELHKNRISKMGEFSVACQVSSSQLENHRLAVQQIQEKIAEAEKAVEDDSWESQKIDHKEWIIEKMKRDGREKELEKKAQAIKDQKARTRERSKSKKMNYY